jgi:hypothetical protein
VGSIPLNTKLESDEDLGVIIHATQAEYAKALKRRLDGTRLEINIQ